MRLAIAVSTLAVLLLSPGARAQAADSCAGLRVTLTAQLRSTEAARVAKAARQRVGGRDVSLVLAEGNWWLVWATPKDAERGVYFFRQDTAKTGWRLVDTWGGIIAPDDRADAIDWAVKLKGGGVSPKLAGCFADAVQAGN